MTPTPNVTALSLLLKETWCIFLFNYRMVKEEIKSIFNFICSSICYNNLKWNVFIRMCGFERAEENAEKEWLIEFN